MLAEEVFGFDGSVIEIVSQFDSRGLHVVPQTHQSGQQGTV
jgi:hypothetical protein